MPILQRLPPGEVHRVVPPWRRAPRLRRVRRRDPADVLPPLHVRRLDLPPELRAVPLRLARRARPDGADRRDVASASAGRGWDRRPFTSESTSHVSVWETARVRIFHIALRSEWDAARRAGSYTTSTRGRTLAEEGFIHASRGDQWQQVYDAFYADVTEPLVLLVIDTDRLTCAGRRRGAGGRRRRDVPAHLRAARCRRGRPGGAARPRGQPAPVTPSRRCSWARCSATSCSAWSCWGSSPAQLSRRRRSRPTGVPLVGAALGLAGRRPVVVVLHRRALAASDATSSATPQLRVTPAPPCP